MSEKCGKCEKSMLPSAVIAKCVECKRAFHPACTRAGSEQSFTKSRNRAWKCDECVDDSASLSSTRSIEEMEDKKSILLEIRSMKADINKNTDERISSVLSSVAALSEDLKNLRGNVTTLQTAHNELQDRCNRLENEKDELQRQMHDLRQQLRDSEQHQRAANIEIVGMPLTQGENIYTCLHQVATALGLPFKREEVSIAHRLRLYGKRHSHPPIVCQFVSRSVKAAWLSAARTKKSFNARDVSGSLPPSPLYINDHLTRDNKALLGKARRLQKEKKIHFAGFFNGKVFVKLSAADDSSIQVTDISQLDRLDKK